MKKISCIYMIVNLNNGNFYIGSTKNYNERFRNHRGLLKTNKHHNRKLQLSFNKNGHESFVMAILELCDIDNLLNREQELLNQLNPTFNISKNTTHFMKGVKHTSVTRHKMKGRKTWNKGLPRTDEEKALISKNRSGIPCPEHIKEELRNKTGEKSYWYGKNLADETKKKIRIGRKDLQRIYCLTNNICYFSQKDAAEALGLRQGHISEHLQGRRANVKGFTFSRIHTS